MALADRIREESRALIIVFEASPPAPEAQATKTAPHTPAATAAAAAKGEGVEEFLVNASCSSLTIRKEAVSPRATCLMVALPRRDILLGVKGIRQADLTAFAGFLFLVGQDYGANFFSQRHNRDPSTSSALSADGACSWEIRHARQVHPLDRGVHEASSTAS